MMISPVAVSEEASGSRLSVNQHILDLLRCVVCLDYFSLEDNEKAPRLLDCSHVTHPLPSLSPIL